MRRAATSRVTLPHAQRADGVPGVRGALARVELTGLLAGQFELELVQCATLVVARQADQTEQPVQRDAAESALRGLVRLRREPDRSSRSAASARMRATCTVAASQCASGKPGSRASVRPASRSRSSPQLT